MSQNENFQCRTIIIFSIVVAMILMLLPLPDSVRMARPEWVLLALIYWAMALPERVGIGYAAITGLCMDILLGSILGILTFTYALVIYLVSHFYLQLRQFPLWQQALSLMSLILLVHISAVVMTSKLLDWQVWIPAFISTLLWPIVYTTLRHVRQVFKVK
ncbi:MAG TPA: rod shape-determining protein MreD [Gammaproteobacteria bacterium]|nr:rod shape-determining protein MreD [Gammaproteobacteria bacterium]